MYPPYANFYLKRLAPALQQSIDSDERQLILGGWLKCLAGYDFMMVLLYEES